MSSRINALRKLLAQPMTKRGSVHEINGDSASVSTQKGVITARIASGLNLSIGDSVKIRDGLIIGTIKSRASLPVYDV